MAVQASQKPSLIKQSVVSFCNDLYEMEKLSASDFEIKNLECTGTQILLLVIWIKFDDLYIAKLLKSFVG